MISTPQHTQNLKTLLKVLHINQYFLVAHGIAPDIAKGFLDGRPRQRILRVTLLQLWTALQDSCVNLLLEPHGIWRQIGKDPPDCAAYFLEAVTPPPDRRGWALRWIERWFKIHIKIIIRKPFAKLSVDDIYDFSAFDKLEEATQQKEKGE